MVSASSAAVALKKPHPRRRPLACGKANDGSVPWRGRPDATSRTSLFGSAAVAADRAASRARGSRGLTRDIAAFPDGYDTVVGERGITLSGGQRQRVALARALCADPQILILDDSLSSVDAETERDILGRLRPILAGRTSILVSHRVAAVKDASQILVVDGGRIAERGTHAELLAAGGVYATLYREQIAAAAAADVADDGETAA